MSDVIDSISGGVIKKCPYCPETREAMDVEVTIALINNHVRRDHALEEE